MGYEDKWEQLDDIGKEFAFRRFWGAVPKDISAIMKRFQKDGYYVRISLLLQGNFVIELQKKWHKKIRIKAEDIITGLWEIGIMSKLNDFASLSEKIDRIKHIR